MCIVEVRDQVGRVVGRIEARGNGNLELRDLRGRLQGMFDSVANETRDASGFPIGKGDLLSRLVCATCAERAGTAGGGDPSAAPAP